MLTVTVRSLDPKTGDPVVLGKLQWNGGAITATKDSRPRLVNLAADPIQPLGTNKWVFPDKEPELFMRSLYLFYHGSYFRCDPAVET